MSDDPFYGIRRTESPDPEEIASAHRWKADDVREVGRSNKTFPRRVALAVGLAAFGVMLCVLTLVARSGAGVVCLAGAGMLLLAALSGWFLRLERYAGYCPRCESCLAPSGSWKPSHPRWCDECDYLCRPEELPAFTGEWHIEVEQLQQSSDSCYNCLAYILGSALLVQFEELIFEPTIDDYHLRAKLNGQWHELEPVAASHRRIIAIARKIWGFEPHGGTPQEGDLIVSLNGQQSAVVEALFEPDGISETLTFRFHHRSDPAAKRVPSDSGVLVG